MQIRRLLAVMLSLLLVSLGLACSGSKGGEDQDSDEKPDGHERMVEQLAKIKQENRYESMFFGRQTIQVQRKRLQAIPESDPSSRFELLITLGKRELWLGNTKAAIEDYQNAYKLLPRLKPADEPRVWEKTVFDLAVAYLRLGENENCVICRNGASCLLPIQKAGVHANQNGSRKAIEYLTILLKRNPEHDAARWLLNIAYMTVGEYPDRVPKALLVPPKAFESDTSFPRFKNVAHLLQLDTVNCSGGSVVDDFDDDGDLDILTSSWLAGDQIRYFRNNGDGSFTEQTKEAGLIGITGGLNMVQADYDNDGDIDVFVLRGAWMRESGRIPNSLLQNDGKGRFRDVTFDAGLGKVHYPTQTAAWADFDNDGDLDLYIGNEEYPSQLFQNDGRGSFTDIAQQAGVQNGRIAKGVTWGDVNGDGYPDLYVSNLLGPNRLYANRRNGTFIDIGPQLGISKPHASFPTWFWDFDNDGILDLYVASYPMGVEKIAADYLKHPYEDENDRLYKGDSQGGFTEVAAKQNLTRCTQPMGSNFGDLDNDGYPDFYLGTGYPGYEGLMPNVMFHNRQGKGFSNVTTAGGFGHLQKGHGVAFADLDNDGDQDIFIELGGAYPGDRFGNALFENPGFGNNWIKLKLIGRESNRSAIGARIKITIREMGKQRSIYKWVNSGGSFGANPLRQDIGLGKATEIDTLEIHWPKTNRTQRFENVRVNQLLRVTEGKNEFESVALKKFVLRGKSP